jgi:hypothetical protein
MAICNPIRQGMTEIESFIEAVTERASLVLSTLGAREQTFHIGQLPFTLVGSSVTQDRLGRAFLNIREPLAALKCLHRLVVWDGTAQEALPPKPPWEATDYTPLGIVGRYSNQDVRFAFDAEISSLIVHNFVDNASHTWLPSIVQLPTWATAAPFRIVLSWLCNLHGMQIVHGAGISIDNKAVLLAGKGGSGKSTTALACALAGWAYLGDDYCAVEPAAGKIHLVYRTAKVTTATVTLLPSLAAWVPNPEQTIVEKETIFLEADHVSLLPSAELSAILLPHIGVERVSKIYPATRYEAIRAILPNTVMQLMGGTTATPRLIMQLAHSLPAFHLSLGTDLISLPDTIASQLSSVV